MTGMGGWEDDWEAARRRDSGSDEAGGGLLGPMEGEESAAWE